MEVKCAGMGGDGYELLRPVQNTTAEQTRLLCVIGREGRFQSLSSVSYTLCVLSFCMGLDLYQMK